MEDLLTSLTARNFNSPTDLTILRIRSLSSPSPCPTKSPDGMMPAQTHRPARHIPAGHVHEDCLRCETLRPHRNARKLQLVRLASVKTSQPCRLTDSVSRYPPSSQSISRIPCFLLPKKGLNCNGQPSAIVQTVVLTSLSISRLPCSTHLAHPPSTTLSQLTMSQSLATHCEPGSELGQRHQASGTTISTPAV